MLPAPAHERAAQRASSRRVTRHHLVLGFLVHERPLDRARSTATCTRTSPVEVEVTLLSCADRLATRGKERGARHRRAPRAGARADAGRARVARARPAARSRSAATSWRARLGIEPGPELGRVLAELREAAYAGEIEDRDDAVELARRLRHNAVS